MHLTPRQLATRWHVSEKTLERWRHTGTGPGFVKIVGRILYPIADIEAIEATGTPPAQPCAAEQNPAISGHETSDREQA